MDPVIQQILEQQLAEAQAALASQQARRLAMAIDLSSVDQVIAQLEAKVTTLENALPVPVESDPPIEGE